MEELVINAHAQTALPGYMVNLRRSLLSCLTYKDPGDKARGRSIDEYVAQLAETLANIEEAADTIHSLSAALDRRALEQMVDNLPHHGNVTIDVGEYKDLSSAAVAACLQIRHSVSRKGGQLILKNVGSELRGRLGAMHLGITLCS